MPECQKIKNGGLDQCGPECFEVYSFDSTGLEKVNIMTLVDMDGQVNTCVLSITDFTIRMASNSN